MSSSSHSKPIGAAFSTFLTFAVVFLGAFGWFTDSVPPEGSSHLDAALPDTLRGRLAEVGVLTAGVILALLFTAIAVHQLWNRCLSDVAPSRLHTEDA